MQVEIEKLPPPIDFRLFLEKKIREKRGKRGQREKKYFLNQETNLTEGGKKSETLR